jgi:hypothetical protein
LNKVISKGDNLERIKRKAPPGDIGFIRRFSFGKLKCLYLNKREDDWLN